MDLDRREFLRLVGWSVLAAALPASRSSGEESSMSPKPSLPFILTPDDFQGKIAPVEGEAPFPEASWFRADAEESGLVYRVPPGALAEAQYLTADLLVEGDTIVVFGLALQEGREGPRFWAEFSALTECQARLRLPLEVVDQNRWRLEREGALLKPMFGGDRVDPARVDRILLGVWRKGDAPARFCLTPITVTAETPPLLNDPLLPKGPLLDELGQSRLRRWRGKSASAEEVTSRLRAQLEAADRHRWPETFSRWGGWKERKVEASGFFRTHHDGKRWWLVDPEGHLFWSAGPDVVGVGESVAAYAGLEKALSWMPKRDGEFSDAYTHWGPQGKALNYLIANLIRAFGGDWHDKWARLALGELRRLGFNTVGNWSEWKIARAAGIAYVRPLDREFSGVPRVFRDFPDVFHPDWPAEVERFAEQLRDTRDDPALIGYFLMNEPTWGFAEDTPAAGMLYNTPSCETRRALAEFLRERYGSQAALEGAWGKGVAFDAVAEGKWSRRLTDRAKADLEEFSTRMVDRLFTSLSEACRRVDPNHLNLGARYGTAPPDWALKGMHSFDVFSFNCYENRVNRAAEKISAVVKRPILIGEWHFGALDAGLPASGLRRVKNQRARGQAYRVYLEDAAAQPWCVGAHWFTLYDQSALGRPDGECYNIGFFDICHRPYEELCAAARRSHERLYAVAAGNAEPYDEKPEYLLELSL